jgi:16S rRNA (guanine1207-N2)-methyltransferase
MTQENLPLTLFEKHREALALANPLMVEDERALFVQPSASAPQPASSAVVFLPKSKALIDMTLSIVSGMVVQNSTIVLAGSNDGGIRSAKDAYERNIGPVREKIVGNHSALYVGTNERRGAGKTVADYLSFTPLSYSGATIDIATLPGVFSAGELDSGTKLLLDHISYDKKSVLDMACGAGTIGTIYKQKNPAATVVMSDDSPLAVLAAQKTIEKNGTAATVVESDAFNKVSGSFDLILCNPPFHKGVKTDYSFIEKFAAQARRHLKPGGQVFVVANAFLPYQEILAKIGPTEIVADDRKFRVYRCR